MTPRDRYLRKKYGITEVEYVFKLNTQGNCCALCKKPHKQGTRRFHVDHNHKTGRVRGLVCFYCNKYRIGRHDFGSALLLYNYMSVYES